MKLKNINKVFVAGVIATAGFFPTYGMNIPGNEAAMNIPGNEAAMNMPGNEAAMNMNMPGNEAAMNMNMPGNEAAMNMNMPGNEAAMNMNMPGNEAAMNMNMPGNEAMMPGNGAANMNAGPFEKMEIVQSHIKVQLIYKSSVGHPAISNTDVLIDFLEEHKNELKEIHACTGGAGASILNWLPEMQSYFQDPLKEDEVGITVEYDQDHDKSTPCHKGGSKQIDVLLAGLKDGKVSKIEVEYYKNSDKIEYKIENEDLNIKK